MPTKNEHIPVVVIGAGFAGITIGSKLREAGIEDFAILERADDVGGVWRDNTYPGCACDVPSVLYSLSFAPNPDWSRVYATQPEILAYARRTANEQGLIEKIRFGSGVERARWDGRHRRWRIRLDDAAGTELTAGVLIGATGPFGEPIIPSIPGREEFAGVSFHSAEWNHDHDLSGRRVAVIGTGASAAQFIPAIQPEVEQLTVFQRTPPWIMPRFDLPLPGLARAANRLVPQLQRIQRAGVYSLIESVGLFGFVDRRLRLPFEALGRLQLARQVREGELRDRVTPDYMLGCKRAILTDAYLPSLTRENVEVVTDPIELITPDGVLTGAGFHAVDTIIWGTGFEAPSRRGSVIEGRGGRSMVDAYDERPQSYLGTCLAGFPNAFVMLGPYSAAGNQSALFMIEAQARYVVDAIETMRERGIEVLEVSRDSQDEFLDEMDRRSEGTVWVDGGCSSYYQTPDGANSGLWPNWSFEFARRTRNFDIDSYEVIA